MSWAGRLATRSRASVLLSHRRACEALLQPSAATRRAQCVQLVGGLRCQGVLQPNVIVVRHKHSAHRRKERESSANHSNDEAPVGKNKAAAGKKEKAEKGRASAGALAEAAAVASESGETDYDDAEVEIPEGSTPSLEDVAGVSALKGRYKKVLKGLEGELQTLRGGRVDAAMLDHVQVDAYGSQMPISDVAQVSVKGPSLLAVTVFDPPLAGSVSAAIRDCGMNLNPISEGTRISVPVPKPSQEARDALVKLAAAATERAKVHLRGIRHKVMERLRKHKDSFPKDDVHRREKEVDAATAAAVEEASKLLENKKKAIQAV